MIGLGNKANIWCTNW